MLRLIARGGRLAPLVFLAGLSAATAQTAPAQKGDGQTAIATFAGGCFWCVEEAFEKVPGVIAAVSGYTGGTVASPSYEQVMTKTTGHFEAVQVTYDPGKVSYAHLVDWFWRNIDPVDPRGQFCDKGSPYRSAIFYHGEEQKKVAEETRQALQARFKEPIATQLVAAGPFYEAEDYHQDYYKKNAPRYQYYKYACRRAQDLEKIWGKPTPPLNLTQ